MSIIEGKVKTIDHNKQEFKATVEGDKRFIEGYFTTDEPDRGGDITDPGAFEKTIKRPDLPT